MPRKKRTPVERPPPPPERTLAQRARDGTALSQRAFAKLIGVSYVTVARWETEAIPPVGTARALLLLVEDSPTRSVRALRRAARAAEGKPG